MTTETLLAAGLTERQVDRLADFLRSAEERFGSVESAQDAISAFIGSAR